MWRAKNAKICLPLGITTKSDFVFTRPRRGAAVCVQAELQGREACPSRDRRVSNRAPTDVHCLLLNVVVARACAAPSRPWRFLMEEDMTNSTIETKHIAPRRSFFGHIGGAIVLGLTSLSPKPLYPQAARSDSPGSAAPDSNAKSAEMRRAPDYQELLKRGYGHIGRVGFLSPGIVDETLSGQFYRMAPPGVTLVRTSLELKDVTIEEVNAAVTKAEKAAAELGKYRPDCIVSADRRPSQCQATVAIRSLWRRSNARRAEGHLPPRLRQSKRCKNTEPRSWPLRRRFRITSTLSSRISSKDPDLKY
jgi:hypothetical protein